MASHANLPLPSRLPQPDEYAARQYPGTYRRTALHAPLCTWDADNMTVDFFSVPAADLDRPIPVLLFLADFPAVLRAESRYLTGRVTTDGNDFWLFNRREFSEIIDNRPGNAAPWPLVFDPAVAIDPAGGANLGQPVVGTTLTNGIERLSGFTTELTPESQADLLTPDGLAQLDVSSLRVLAISQGAVIDGRGNGELVEYDGTGSDDVANPGNAYVPRQTIILQEDQYTLAMRQAGNQIVTAAQIIQIVGLYAPNPAP